MSIAIRRSSAFAMAFALVASMMVVLAPAALAHHPEVGYSVICDQAKGELNLSVTGRSWSFVGSDYGNHNDVRLQMRVKTDAVWSGWQQVGSGAYTQANGRQFTVHFGHNSAVGGLGTLASLAGKTAQVRAQVQDILAGDGVGWYNNAGTVTTAAAGNTHELATSGEFTIPRDCVPPPPGDANVWVEYGCTENGFFVRSGTENATIVFKVGDTVVNPNAVDPGTVVTWMATANSGYAFDEGETTSGQFTVVGCEEAWVSISYGCDGNEFYYSADKGHATVSFEVIDGVVYWTATADPGYEFDDESTEQSGSFPLDDCGPPPTTPTTQPTLKTVTVTVDGLCSAQDGLGYITIDIEPDGKASVTVNGAAHNNDANIGGLAAGVYPWSVVPVAGYALSGLSNDVVIVGDCVPPVSVGGIVVESSTTIPAVSGETLPFTGFELENTALLALAALMTGAGLILISSLMKKEEESVSETHIQW